MKDVFDVKRSANGDEVLKKLNGQYLNVITVTDAARELYDYESGSIVVCTNTTGGDITITLPTMAAGLNFKFILSASPSSNDIIVTATSDDADNFAVAVAADSGADGTFDAAADKFIFEAAALGGETVDVVSDGTKWYAFAHQGAIGGVTYTG